jgi:hypothetical protein
MVIPSLDMSFEREEQILRTWVEDYLGGVDFGLANDNSSLTEARTATEMNMIGQRARQSLSLRGLLFQRMMGPVYQDMLDLHLTWGDDKVFIELSGGQSITLTKEEMQGKFVLVPTGTIGEADPQMMAQKAQQRVLMLMQAKQADIMGDQWDIDLGQAVLDWMQHDDPRAAKRILRKRSPQEIEQLVAARQQVQQQQQQQALAMEYMKSKPATPPTGGSSKPSGSAASPQGLLPSSIAQLVGATSGAQPQ